MTKLIQKLRTTNSTDLKRSMLVFDADETDKKVFRYAYDPFKKFGVRSEFISERLGEATPAMFQLLDQLAARELTGDKARAMVRDFSHANGDLIYLICNKDLDCGVSAVTLNSAFGPHFIPKFNIQLAVKKPIEKVTLPINAQIKYNGARVLAFVHDGSVIFRSRGGHEFGFPELRESLVRSPLGAYLGYVLDGELTKGDSAGFNHTSVSGMVNSAIKGNPIPYGQGLVFNVFDCMPVDEFHKMSCPRPYVERFGKVKQIVDSMRSKNVQVALNQVFENRDELKAYYDKLLGLGYEGLILKSDHHKYTFKKNDNWIKLKAEEPADLLCVGVNPGSGKYEGMIGSLQLQGTVNGKFVTVDCGSGMTDYDRSRPANTYVGKTIEITYNDVVMDTSTNKWSLFIPVYQSVREDKS